MRRRPPLVGVVVCCCVALAAAVLLEYDEFISIKLLSSFNGIIQMCHVVLSRRRDGVRGRRLRRARVRALLLRSSTHPTTNLPNWGGSSPLTHPRKRTSPQKKTTHQHTDLPIHANTIELRHASLRCATVSFIIEARNSPAPPADSHRYALLLNCFDYKHDPVRESQSLRARP